MDAPISVFPGERVFARDRGWRVTTRQDISEHACLLGLEAIDGQPGRTLTVCVPPDEVVPMSGESPSLSPTAFESFGIWARQHAVLASTFVRGADLLTGARLGRVVVESYQLAPALRLLRKPRPSLLIADDVGLGKTIEAGLAMLELIARRRADRILVVAPPGLLLQWQSELLDKFDLDFALIENAAGFAREQTSLPAGVNAWDGLPRVLTSVDYLKKETVRKRALRKRWDLVVVDEAHSLAEAGTPANPYRTQRTRLGAALRESCRGLLLLTATPHNGHAHSFRSLIELVEPTAAAFSGSAEDRVRRVEGARIRRLKSQIKRRLEDETEVDVFPPRDVQGIPVRPDGRWGDLFRKVSSYCSKTARSARGTDDDELVTFAMQIVKKRALSSRRALEQTIAHRLEALRSKEPLEQRPDRAEIREYQADLPMTEAAAERTAVRIVRAALPREEKLRKSEISALNSIKKLLKALPDGDPKVDALLAQLRGVLASDPSAKFIVFTEYLDTLASIREAIERDADFRGRVVEIRGGMSGRQRAKVQARFEEPEIRVLLATDAASEGLNLQRACHRVIHVELPWNPNRLEQRNGRVDRYGQSRNPWIRYLFYPDSPEDDVLHRLIERIKTMHADRISTPDILGVLSGTSLLDSGLVDLDADAGDVEQRKQSLVRVFEDRTAEFVRDVQPLVAARGDDRSEMQAIIDQLDRAHPLTKDDAALESLVTGLLGSSSVKPAGDGLVRIDVPAALQGPRVASTIPRATFRRSIAIRHRPEEVEFVTQVHPLVRAIADDARRRLQFVYPDDRGLPPRRLAARRVPRGEPTSAVFTFVGSIHGKEGTLEEELIAVRIGMDGTSIGATDDAVRWLDPSAAPGEVPFASIERTFKATFDFMSRAAAEAANAIQRDRTRALREARAGQVRLLRTELEKDLADRLHEIDEEERRARELVEEGGQGVMFPRSEAAMPSLDQRRAAARSFAETRLAELADFETVLDPGPAHPLGVLFLVPEGVA